jgi:hypothetical protein
MTDDDEACRRLLDMIAGWAAHVDPMDEYWEDRVLSAPPAECILVNDLYQAAGELSTMADVVAFVHNKVLPAILNGVKK